MNQEEEYFYSRYQYIEKCLSRVGSNPKDLEEAFNKFYNNKDHINNTVDKITLMIYCFNNEKLAHLCTDSVLDKMKEELNKMNMFAKYQSVQKETFLVFIEKYEKGLLNFKKYLLKKKVESL